MAMRAMVGLLHSSFHLPHTTSLPPYNRYYTPRPALPVYQALLAPSLPSHPMTRKAPVLWKEVDALIRSTGDCNAYALGCTSTVTSPSLKAEEWYCNSLLIPHEGMRFLFLVLERVVQPQYFEPVRAWKVRRLFRFYRHLLLVLIHEHHTGEDAVLFPWVSAKAPLPPQLGDEHVGLLQRLDAIDAMEAAYHALKPDDSQAVTRWAASLREQVEALGELMREHLAEEEALVTPRLRDHFTAAEHSALIQQLAGRVANPANLAGAASICCAGQLRAGGEPLLALFLLDMPPPVTQAWQMSWRARVEAEMVYVQSIVIDQEDEPAFDTTTLFPTA
jgi:hemerythrin-like domain-containing protein